MQTFSQYLQSLGGTATKQTSLHSTMDNENIAGLYKQQQSDDQFKVGSPSGSVYWTAGELPTASACNTKPSHHGCLVDRALLWTKRTSAKNDRRPMHHRAGTQPFATLFFKFYMSFQNRLPVQGSLR